MILVVCSVLDLARVQSVRDPEAHPQAAVHWHISPETVVPHWLKRAQPVRGLSRLAKLPAHGDCHVAQGGIAHEVAGRRAAGDADSHHSHHTGMLLVGPTQDAGQHLGPGAVAVGGWLANQVPVRFGEDQLAQVEKVLNGTLEESTTIVSGPGFAPLLRPGARVCDRGFFGADYAVVDAALIRPGAASVSLRTAIRRRSRCGLSSARRNRASPRPTRSPFRRCRNAELRGCTDSHAAPHRKGRNMREKVLRATTLPLMSGAVALVGSGPAIGIAQAEPIPAPLYHWCPGDFWTPSGASTSTGSPATTTGTPIGTITTTTTTATVRGSHGRHADGRRVRPTAVFAQRSECGAGSATEIAPERFQFPNRPTYVVRGDDL